MWDGSFHSDYAANDPVMQHLRARSRLPGRAPACLTEFSVPCTQTDKADTMNTLIRPATAADIAGLIELSRRTISACYRSFLGEEAVDGFIGSGAADQYIRDNIGRCLVLCRAGKIVGWSVCRDQLIDLMMIDCACHRQGLGSQLLAHVEQQLFGLHGELKLESFEGNQQANAFYRKHGWRELSRHFDRDAGAGKIVFGKTN